MTPPFHKCAYMTRRKMVAGTLIALLPTAAIVACNVVKPEWRYRYRLSAEIERKGKIYRGSSVVEVIRSKGYSRVEGRARGEAVAIDVTGIGTLFLLLRGDWGNVDWPFVAPHHAFKDTIGSASMTDPSALDRLSQMQGTSAILTPETYPLMVMFRNMDDPTSIELVNHSDLTPQFGPGAKLIKVKMTITYDDITTGIWRRFSWWKKYTTRHFDGSSIDVEDLKTDDLRAHLSSFSFSTETPHG